MSSPKRLARIAGVLYLVVAVFGGFAHLFVRATIHVPGDAGQTAANIVQNTALFRAGLAADIAMATVFVFLGIALYRLLQHAHQRAAAALVLFVSVGSGLILLNLVFHVAALLVATDSSLGSALGSESSAALALLMLEIHDAGYALSGIFFGLWLLPLGFLAIRSGMFPRPLGLLLIAGGVSYFVETLVNFLVPALPVILHELISLPKFAELWMVLYLIIIGVRTAKNAPICVEAAS